MTVTTNLTVIELLNMLKENLKTFLVIMTTIIIIIIRKQKAILTLMKRTVFLIMNMHMNIIDLGGDQMVAFYRHRFAEHILRSRSSDAGRNWSAPEPTNLPNNNSSIQAARLADGRIAVVYNHSSALFSEKPSGRVAQMASA